MIAQSNEDRIAGVVGGMKRSSLDWTFEGDAFSWSLKQHSSPMRWVSTNYRDFVRLTEVTDGSFNAACYDIMSALESHSVECIDDEIDALTGDEITSPTKKMN